MLDVIIVGAGPVGLYAAHLAALHKLKGILLESREEIGGQINLYPQKALLDVPSYISIPSSDYLAKLIEQYKADTEPLELHLSESLLSFEKMEDGFKVVTNEGVYETKTILLACGMGSAQPRKMGIENEDSFKNIIYSLKDKSLVKGKKVIILGGGDSAVDMANMIVNDVESLAVIHRRNEFRAQSSSVDTLRQSKANIYTPFVGKEIIGYDGKLEGLVIKEVDGDKEISLPADYIFVNYGMVPAQNNFPLEKKGNNILVDSYSMTSMPGVFAIGDNAYYEGKVKNITCGMGEAVKAITKIDQLINPLKNIPAHF